MVPHAVMPSMPLCCRSAVIIGYLNAISTRARHAVLACYVLGLLALTLAPLPETAYRLSSAEGFDKAVHFALFGGFTLLLYWDLLRERRPRLVGMLGVSGSLAALVEVAQGLLGYRTQDFWDFAWGTLGSLAAYLVGARLGTRG